MSSTTSLNAKQMLKWVSDNYDSLITLSKGFNQIATADTEDFTDLILPEQQAAALSALRPYSTEPDEGQMIEIFVVLCTTQDFESIGKAETWTPDRLHQWLWDEYTANGTKGSEWDWEGEWLYDIPGSPIWPTSTDRKTLVLLLLELISSQAIMMGWAGIDITQPAETT